MIPYRKEPVFITAEQCPQAGRERMTLPQPVANYSAEGYTDPEPAMLEHMRKTGAVFMMGQNPKLPVMPKKPTLLDFFHYRFCDIAFRHLLQSAKHAMDAGCNETVIMACLLHDISNGAFLRTDHGYWGAQMVAPYVSEEVSWAIKYHQALRYFADEPAGFKYPEAYLQFFGPGYEPPEYIQQAYREARNHKWYMTSRLITIHDIYSFRDDIEVDPDIFTDLIGRHWKQPAEGLGFDNSPVAHIWRTMIWPNNFL
ncbi:MAG: HD domain-containing protein [Nevskiaceae bacterium]|nr:HD domain-containing protein [Nevskiaceae bacterium]